MPSLKDKTVLVIGRGGGIARAAAKKEGGGGGTRTFCLTVSREGYRSEHVMARTSHRSLGGGPDRAGGRRVSSARPRRPRLHDLTATLVEASLCRR